MRHAAAALWHRHRRAGLCWALTMAEPQTLTILLTDLVDSTKLVAALGDERALEVMGRHDRLARRILAAHRGREIDKSDGFLMIFEGAVDGVRFALAYHRALRGRPAPVALGLTGDQQFFLSFGQSWRWKAREQALRNGILTDGHAPSQYRALTVRNIDPWYQAFDVRPGQALYLPPADRVRVW